MTEREFSEEQRAEMAGQGIALPDGSYPMPDCDAVRRAIDSYGRAPDSHRGPLAELIRERNSELECHHQLDQLAGDDETGGDDEEGQADDQ
jgi:hypothetical protein